MDETSHAEQNPTWDTGDPWYLLPSNYEGFCDDVGLEESQYLKAVHTLLKIIPRDDATSSMIKLMNKNGSIIHEPLHPNAFSSLNYHPLEGFISGLTLSYWHLADTVRLGQDIVMCNNIPWIESLTKRLKTFSEYTGVLFEIEVLSDLCRAGIQNINRPSVGTPDFEFDLSEKKFFVEAKHRGVYSGMVIAQEIKRRFTSVDLGKFEIILKPEINLQDGKIKMDELLDRMVTDARSLVSQSLNHLVRVEYDISHYPDSGQRVVEIKYGGITESYTEVVSGLVQNSLVEKEQKFTEKGLLGDEVAIVAMDLRSQFPAQPPLERYSDTTYMKSMMEENLPNLGSWYDSVYSTVQNYIDLSNVLSGVLLYLPDSKRAQPIELRDYYKLSRTITLITKQGTATITSPEDLKKAFEAKFNA